MCCVCPVSRTGKSVDNGFQGLSEELPFLSVCDWLVLLRQLLSPKIFLFNAFVRSELADLPKWRYLCGTKGLSIIAAVTRVFRTLSVVCTYSANTSWCDLTSHRTWRNQFSSFSETVSNFCLKAGTTGRPNDERQTSETQF